MTPTDVKSAGARCAAVGRILEERAGAFRDDAAPTPRCFGLVEGASRELDDHYLDFYTEVSDYVTDLHQKLTTAGAALMLIGRNQELVDAHEREHMDRLPDGD
ncbi:hypothetical protein [Nonomuraea sp. NPDC048916]|uniref:hypothetical protein n=1 Tax=Nonomuraea sp. NPDC048916 TaxID=3154232 RepID=UPI0033EC72D3